MSTTRITSTTAPDGTTSTTIEVEHHGTGSKAAAPAPAAAIAPPSFSNGCMAYVIKGEVSSPEGMAKMQPFFNNNDGINKYVGCVASKAIQTSPTTVVWCAIYPSADAWLKVNTVLPNQAGFMEVMGFWTSVEGVVFGDVTPAAKAAIEMWNQGPGFNLVCAPLVGHMSCEYAADICDSAMECGFIYIQEYNSAADAEKSMSMQHNFAGDWMNNAVSNASAFLNPTTMMGVGHFKGEADWASMNAAMGTKQDIMAEWLPLIKMNTVYPFGPGSDEFNASCAQWNQLPMMDVSPCHNPIFAGYNAECPNGFMNVITYDTAEDMAKWSDHCNKTWTAGAKAAGATTFVMLQKSPTVMIFLCMFPDNAAWIKTNADTFGQDPKIPEMFAVCTMRNELLGKFTAAGEAMMRLWRGDSTTIAWLDSTPAVTYFGPHTQSDTKMQYYVNAIYTSPEEMDRQLMANEYSTVSMAAKAATGATCYALKTGPKSMTQVWSFPSEEAWLECNDAVKEIMMADDMAAVKGIAALEGNWWYGGTLSAKGQEAIDGWAAVPHFKLQKLEVVGGFA